MNKILGSDTCNSGNRMLRSVYIVSLPPFTVQSTSTFRKITQILEFPLNRFTGGIVVYALLTFVNVNMLTF